ncbi:hypothetical protein [Fuerstiella marisgermanici]|uniref:Uncharacterized protein n=1 Tax=Fuerstiella marisgermanici TaxID=1891926 RepID=A0A1P8WRZ1_9PLAN|nr:hypothetical protein [Fuerstiella marisgermanici]APZ96820.1 hypothetical protein Fuma_06494 [Fuerstiella marisgermanici]
MPLHVAGLALCVFFCGCQTAAKQQLAAIARFDEGKPQQAVEALTLAAEKRGAELEIIAVDRGIAALMAGDAASSETLLRKTREQMDFLRQKDVREQTQAVLTDDKAIAWAGREFEQRMVDNLLVLSSLMNDRGDAFAYATQVMNHVADEGATLAENSTGGEVVAVSHSDSTAPTATVPSSSVLPATPPPPPERLAANALSAYLSAVVHSENAMDSDVTNRALQQVAYWQPDAVAVSATQQLQNPVVMTEFGTQTSKGHGTVHVIVFAGRVTNWTSETAAPTSAALLLADQILSAVGDHSVPPTIAPVKIARPVHRGRLHPFSTEVRFPGPDEKGMRLTAKTIVDLNQVAWASYEHNRDQQLARAVARRIVKKGAVYAAKDQLAITGDSGADLLLNLGGIAWEALEKADTRHVHLLPERIEVAQASLPAGDHDVEIGSSTILAFRHLPTSASTQTVRVHVEDGRNTFILCFRPSDKSGEQVIVTSK